MRWQPWFSRLLPACAVMALAASTATATVIFDQTSSLISANSTIVEPGTMGGTAISLSQTSPDPMIPPIYNGSFGTVDFTPPGGTPALTTAAEADGFLRFTVKALPESMPGDTLRLFVGQDRPDFGSATIAVVRNYLYDFTVGDLMSSDFVTLTTRMSDWDLVTQLIFENGAFVEFQSFNPPNGDFDHNFDEFPVTVMGFQTPTTNGVDDGDNTGPIFLEVLSVEIIVPEPASAAVALIGLFGCAAAYRRR